MREYRSADICCATVLLFYSGCVTQFIAVTFRFKVTTDALLLFVKTCCYKVFYGIECSLRVFAFADDCDFFALMAF